MNKKSLINRLSLEPHPIEGGYYKRTYTSDLSVVTDNGDRKLLSSIFYMLTDDSPVGYLHKNTSDIIHYYQLGGATQYLVIYPDGSFQNYLLGPDIENGHVLQLTVPGNCWKGSRLVEGEFSLISEAVSPGFDYADNSLAKSEDFVGFAEHALKAAAPYFVAKD